MFSVQLPVYKNKVNFKNRPLADRGTKLTSWCLTELSGQMRATSSLRVMALSQHRVENFPQPPSHLATLIFVWETQPSSLVIEIRWGIRVQFSGATAI